MDTRQLRYFVAVAEERHFGRAADRLHMAQPPLSQQIRLLEAQLGVQLLVRTTRKVDLTPAGTLLLERGRRILEDLDALETDVAQVSEGIHGVLRMGFTGSAIYGLMPRLVREAKRSLPGLSLGIRGEMLTPALVSDLEEHRLDVAVLRPPVRSGQLELAVIDHDRLIVALPEDSPLAVFDTLTLDQLAGQPFVGYPADSAVAAATIDACQGAGFFPRIIQEARETSTLLSFTAAGTGIALIPASARAFAIQGTVFRELQDAPTVALALAWRRGDDSSLLARFIKLVTDMPEVQRTARTVKSETP